MYWGAYHQFWNVEVSVHWGNHRFSGVTEASHSATPTKVGKAAVSQPRIHSQTWQTQICRNLVRGV